jgi:oxygen-independent coproporphyrinogen-3 oxidase
MDSSRLASAFARAVPRYTSYPTAAQFGAGVDAATFAAWLARVPADAPVSLYLHVPYCRSLCWYCACHARVARGAETLARYRDALVAEIGAVGRAIGRRPRAARIHWGGGTPTTLETADFARVHAAIAAHFDVTPDAEIAVEIDPRSFRAPMAAALRALGVTRASFGVQDFDPDVQAAINRIQPFDVTRRAVDALRAAGIGSINLDLIYGLPRQTEAGLARTAELTLDLAPDRIALFGYAHVPWMKRHQTLIRAEELPGPEARWRQSRLAESMLTQAGYVPIGIDHFARPGDALARAAAQFPGLHRR